MKKMTLLIICLILFPLLSHAELIFLKLRSSQHPGFLRIVLEGRESIIHKGLVHQRGQSILVAFPETFFSVQVEKGGVPYRKLDQSTVMFSPGNFKGIKVFTLKHPPRLVIDVYASTAGRVPPPVLPPPRKEERGLRGIETVVIDPGHGGYEDGIVLDGNKEKNVVLDIAKKLRALISRGPSKGFLTRGSDRYMSLSERVRYSSSKNADVFISIHVGNHSGVVIYAPVITEHTSDLVRPYLEYKGQKGHLEETFALINAMKEAVTTDFGDDMVTVRPMPFSIISRVEAAALMIELPSFEDAYYIEEMKSEIANTIYKGLYIYEEFKAK